MSENRSFPHENSKKIANFQGCAMIDHINNIIDKQIIYIRKVSMKKNKKRIAALICIVLLVLLYVVTLVVALFDFPGSDRMFAACLMATVGLPILLWIYIWVYGKFTGKHTITDPLDVPPSSGAPRERKEDEEEKEKEKEEEDEDEQK